LYGLLALVTGLIFLFSGFLLKALGAGGRSRNPVAGYRSAWSMKSPETWIAANRYAAKAFNVAGAVILLIGAVLWWKPLPRYNEFIILGLMFIGLAIIVLTTENYLKRHFNADGTPRTLPQSNIAGSHPGPAGVKRSGKLPYSRLEYLLEIISVTGIILGAGLLIYYWPQLPDLVPRHYNFQGVVDAWGSRGTVPALPIVNVLLYLFLTLLRIFVPSHTGSSPRRSLILSMELLAWVKAWTVGIFTYLTWSTVEIALGRVAALSPIFLPLVVGLSLVIVAVYCVLILRGEGSR
jgi:uncharacterized membrane protein